MKEFINEFKRTCKHLASCLPETKFIETDKGGFFVKGNRKIGTILVDNKNRPLDDGKSFKINKWKNGFGLNVDSRERCCYYALKKSVSKGLGIPYKDF